MDYTSRKTQLRKERKAQGLCPECGERPPREGRYDCEECAEKKAERNKELRKIRKFEGRCVRCGGPRPCSCLSRVNKKNNKNL